MIRHSGRADDPVSGRSVVWAFTDATGGHSTGSHAGLNLGGHVGDDPGAVEANRADVAAALGVPRERLLFVNQVHGVDVVTADGPWEGEVPSADALVTTRPGLALGSLVADCVPVILHDVRAGVVGAVHAGRQGMAKGVVLQALSRMRELGAGEVSAVVGPSICGRCYEVPESMRDEVARVAPVAATVSRDATPALDVAPAVIEQIASTGVPRERITWHAECTREDPELYSHRRDPGAGRFAGIVAIVDNHPHA